MPPHPYRLVIFDFDGTLADSFPWFVGVVNALAARYAFRRVEDGELDYLRGLGARELIRHLGVPYWKLPFIARHVRELKSREIERISLFAGIDGMLARLAERGVRLAIVSSNSEANVRKVLGPGVSDLIADFDCAASLFGKRINFLRVLKRSGVRAAEALCVGDEIRDLEAAGAAGIEFGAVGWGFTRAEALAARRPRALFRTVDSIVPFVLEGQMVERLDTPRGAVPP